MGEMVGRISLVISTNLCKNVPRHRSEIRAFDLLTKTHTDTLAQKEVFIDTRDKNHSKNFNQIGSYDYVHLHCTGIDGKVVECYMRHKTESITMDIFCQIFLE